ICSSRPGSLERGTALQGHWKSQCSQIPRNIKELLEYLVASIDGDVMSHDRGESRKRTPMRNPVRNAAIVIVIAMMLAGVSIAHAQKRGGTLRVAYGNEIAGLDFHVTAGYEMIWVATNVGCGLLSITPEGKFVPDAAESWQISPDGLLYTFKLRNNVVFHDGAKVDAAAVKFNIERIMDPVTRSSVRTFYESVHSVEVLDPLTVQIRLKHPYAFMLHMLAAYRMGLVLYSPAAIQKYSPEDRRAGKPEATISCGPF